MNTTTLAPLLRATLAAATTRHTADAYLAHNVVDVLAAEVVTRILNTACLDWDTLSADYLHTLNRDYLPAAYTWNPAEGTLTHPTGLNAGQARTVFTLAAHHAAITLATRVAANPDGYLTDARN